MRTVGDMLAERSGAYLVGREQEQAVLLELLQDEGPLVVVVHGLGGIGKTALVDAFADAARRLGVAVVAVDCRTAEPTERGLLRELA
ncbi:MAG: ATP-binding protein, partial [Nitriliruptorales bacterium]